MIRGELAAYTEEQCALHAVKVESVPAGVFWNPDEQRWESHYARLPVYEDKGIVLVPKLAVRRRLVPDPDEFYDRFVLHFLEAEHLRARDALVYIFRVGREFVLLDFCWWSTSFYPSRHTSAFGLRHLH